MMNSINKIRSVRSGGMKSIIILSLISILLLPSNAGAVKMLSGDQIRVDSPIEDDIFAAGGAIDINAPVDGVVIAGGTININAPVNGDVFVAGGQVSVNSNVKGKIVAAGGNIDIRGNARNVVLAGGNVNIHSTAVISRDAVISGGSVNNAGRINGNLTVRAENFQNTGSAGSVEFMKSEVSQSFQRAISTFRILITLGFLILGMIILKLFPAQFFKVEEEIRKSTLLKTVVGFVLIIVSAVVIILVAVTVIGFPLAAVMAMLFIIALMLSTIFVSFTFGKKILDLFKLKTTDIWIFVLGFIILSLLFRIPYAGGFIQIVAVSLGFGAVCYALRGVWEGITHRGA
ncbi:MAG: polymer-forming cytoskeletal protein [Candidatus Methanoperedens sp.]|nr:polymer-forming cytoskeletal protein [Candidatus Methanoperedens sp.]MCZ7394802.1 polymer-forming cytoskeletal protein [Candidatus Methanoperedens sp.]